VVDTIFFDAELALGDTSNNKPNEEWFLSTNYARFVSVVSRIGIKPVSEEFGSSSTARSAILLAMAKSWREGHRRFI
jgi:hypothetical protein